MANFKQAYELTAINEGGYANVLGDRGGETYKGIARNMHPNWRGWAIVDKHKPLKHNVYIKSIELDNLVESFYKLNFWDKVKGDLIQDQKVANFLYDYYVHSGNRASKQVQKLVSVNIDGVIGAKSIEAINNTKSLFTSLYNERKSFLTSLSKQSNQSKFLQGWLNRINKYL